MIREDRSSGARRAKRCWSRQPFLRVPCRRELADQEYKRSPLPASAKVSQPKLCYSTTQAERSPLKHVGFPSTGNSRNSSGSTTTLRTLQLRLTRICLVSSLANLINDLDLRPLSRGSHNDLDFTTGMRFFDCQRGAKTSESSWE